MARPTYHHARHGIFDLRRIVSHLPLYSTCTLNAFHRKYESGGLNLTAGDFAQLSRLTHLACFHFTDDEAQLH